MLLVLYDITGVLSGLQQHKLFVLLLDIYLVHYYNYGKSYFF
jgi:hypothetical protein